MGLSIAAKKTTVIRFFFAVKIFSYRENVRKFFTRILFYNEKFSDEYLGQVRTYVVMMQWLARETSDRSLGWRLAPTTRHCTAYRASSSQEQGTHFRDLPWQVSNDSFLLQYRYGVPVSHVGRLPATHQLFPNRCCPYIFVRVVASNTTSYLLLTAASHLNLSNKNLTWRAVRPSQLMPTTRVL